MKSTNSARRKPISVAEAWDWVVDNFPFPGYIVPRRRSAYEELVREALAVRPAGSRVLDFGAGPADKTALFALAGYQVVAYDDFLDPWHLVDGNIDKILSFARGAGIDYRAGPDPWALLKDESFDVIMLHHVLEHLHDSPRALLLRLMEHLRPGGVLYVTVPNAVNIRKRLAVLFGRTNYPSYPSFYWYPGPFRGYIREYVFGDLRALSGYLDLRNTRLRSYFHFPHAAPAPVLMALRTLSLLAPGWRDSLMLIGEKPREWRPEMQRSGVSLAESLGRGEYYDYEGFDPQTDVAD